MEYLKTRGKCKSLARLNPFLHNDTLMLGDRVGNAGADRPILPHNHAVTELIIQHYHVEAKHAGIHQVPSTLRKHFWVAKGASVVKRVLKSCSECKLLNAKSMQQQMAPLSECRMTSSTGAFDSCGIDYFGPLLVQQGRSTVKR